MDPKTLMMTPPSLLSLVAFLGVLTFVVGAVILGVFVAASRLQTPKRARAITLRFTFGLAMWLTLVAMVVNSGLIVEAPVPRALIFLGACNLAGLFLGLSPIGTLLASGLPTGVLIAFQAFRLPLEFILHNWAASNTIPTSMTWDGSNFDVITGVAALAVLPYADRSRTAAWVFNIGGICLLLNVGRVALLSSPMPFGWHTQPPLLLPFFLPYALIVPICLAGAIVGHVVLTRRLLQVGSTRKS